MSPFQASARGCDPAGDPRAADEQGHLGGRVVGDELALVEAVLALHQALVGGEDQIGVAQRPPRLQIVDDPLHRIVDREQRLEAVLVAGLDLGDQPGAEALDPLDPGGLVLDVLLVEARVDRQRGRGEGIRVLRLGCGGIVRREELHLHVEGRVREVAEVVVDPLDREVRVDVGRVVVRRVGLVDAVLVEGEAGVRGGRTDEAVELALRGGADAARERAPARRHVGLVRHLSEAVRHLADVDGAVAIRLQPDGQVVLVVEGLVAALRRRVAEDAGVVGVIAGLHRDAGRAAEWIRGVGVQEARPGIADQGPRLGHHRHVPERLIVGGEHDHVGLGACRTRLLAAGEQHERGQAGDSGQQDSAPEQSATGHQPN